MHFRSNKYLIIASEVSETPYPKILRIRHADILNIHIPIAVYCICPEEAYLDASNQREIRDLKSHGYGLITVDKAGVATLKARCIPLIQHLPESEFKSEIKPLPKGIRLAVRDAYSSYQNSPPNGVKDISETLELLIIKAAKGAEKNGWVSNNTSNKSSADILDKLNSCKECYPIRAEIGRARSYIKSYRNKVHHTPKSKKDAYIKYQDCLHGFREGIKCILSFREAMKKAGVNISI